MCRGVWLSNLQTSTCLDLLFHLPLLTHLRIHVDPANPWCGSSVCGMLALFLREVRPPIEQFELDAPVRV